MFFFSGKDHTYKWHIYFWIPISLMNEFLFSFVSLEENEKTTRMELIRSNYGENNGMLRFTYYVRPECEAKKFRGSFSSLLRMNRGLLKIAKLKIANIIIANFLLPISEIQNIKSQLFINSYFGQLKLYFKILNYVYLL